MTAANDRRESTDQYVAEVVQLFGYAEPRESRIRST